MKLALVVPGGVDRSGVDRVVPALLWQVERLARRHTVHIFALSQESVPARWELLGATVHNVGMVGARRRRFLAWFSAEHACGRFDVIHAFWAGSGTYAAAVSRLHRIPFVVHLAGGELVALHDIGYGGRQTWKGRVALRITLGTASHISVASDFMRQLGRVQTYEAEYVPLGVALDSWPPVAPRERETNRPARLLHIGDLRPVKDQRMLLTAAAILRDNGVAFHLDIVGHDTMNGETQRLGSRLGLDSAIRWHGVLHRDTLRELVVQADMLLVTSRHEAGPVAFLEAAVAGVPTVGTAVGHVADWAPNAAVSVPVSDAPALAAAVTGLLADERRRLAIAREAQRRAVAIDADHTSMLFERAYSKVSASHRRGPTVTDK